MGRIVTRTFRRGGRSVRQNLWIGLQFAQTSVTEGTTGVLLASMNAAALALRPFTIVRSRWAVHIETNQSAASEQYQGAIGAMVVSDQAAATGIGAIPKPLTNSDGDWFVHEPYAGSFTLGDATGFIESTGSGSLINVDSKAMRKVGNNEDLVIVAEGISNGVVIAMIGRVLVKLH